MRKSNFKNLQVWLKGIALCPDLYRLTKTFPDSEKFGLCSQIQRAAVSVCTNIAEGHGRSSNQDFVRFLYMSLGSLQELETLIIIGQALGYVDEIESWTGRIQEINRMTCGLIGKLQSNGPNAS